MLGTSTVIATPNAAPQSKTPSSSDGSGGKEQKSEKPAALSRLKSCQPTLACPCASVVAQPLLPQLSPLLPLLLLPAGAPVPTTRRRTKRHCRQRKHGGRNVRQLPQRITAAFVCLTSVAVCVHNAFLPRTRPEPAQLVLFLAFALLRRPELCGLIPLLPHSGPPAPRLPPPTIGPIRRHGGEHDPWSPATYPFYSLFPVNAPLSVDTQLRFLHSRAAPAEAIR